MVEQDVRIGMLVKAPLLGTVKTRMSTVLDDEQCLRLHQDLFLEAFSNIQHLPIDIWVTQLTPWIEQLAKIHNKKLFVQQGNDLGARMKNICSHYLREHVSPILLGSDCPFISGEYMANVMSTLPHFEVLFGPAMDGGYILLALNAHHAMELHWQALFEGVSWGHSTVLQQSLNRCEQEGWDWKLLDGLPDIDRPDELHLLESFERFAWLREEGLI